MKPRPLLALNDPILDDPEKVDEALKGFGEDPSPFTPSTRVEIETDLLGRLRKRHPERSDRELLESAARIQLGREAIARVRKRFAGVPMEEIESEAAKAVREVRREQAAERRATD